MTPTQVLERYWRLECTRDLDDIMACYAPDAVFEAPGYPALHGPEAIRRFYADSCERFPALAVEIANAVEAGDRAAAEWRATFHDRFGRRFRARGVNVVRTENDRLREVRVYFDPASLDQPDEAPDPA